MQWFIYKLTVQIIAENILVHDTDTVALCAHNMQDVAESWFFGHSPIFY